MGNPGAGKVTSDRHGLADRAVSCLRRRDVAIKTMVLAILLIGPYTQHSAPPARGAMTIKTVTRTYVLENVAGVPKWDRNGFIIHDLSEPDQPVVWVHNRKGELVCRLSPIDSLPDVHDVGLWDVAVTKDGTILIALIATNSKGQRASALLEYNTSCSLERIIKTDPFGVHKIAADDDGNIWMLGHDWQKYNLDDEYGLIRKISADGVPLIASLPRSLFPRELDPLDLDPEEGFSPPAFEVIGDRVYTWLPGARMIVVLDRDGRVLRSVLVDDLRTLFDPPATKIEVLSFAFLPQEGLFIDVQSRENKVRGRFFSPDLGRSWFPVVDSRENPWGSLLIGFSRPTEAVAIRLLGPRTRVVEFCWVEF